ncbi:transcriptional regulator [Leptospira ryugenii]|uniref:Transcriptional regulator n=1 Tax=Leptospira ryugenii TaxID=1917863 RepID=A0A2P2E2J1_9LEPT|nr:sigma 54-interacting transcriptional regulator [Leptospira ryugenii]GBF51112.1 transcriptional regulator [Leptospira ryugenii]
MSRQNDISATIRRIQKEIRSLPNISDRLNFILDETLTLFGASTGSISIADSEENVLTIVAAKGMDWEKKIAAKLPFALGVTGHAASSREIIYVPDVSKDPSYIKLIESVRSELAIPLLTRDTTIGVLNLESDKVNFFGPDVINQANLFASQLTIVLLEERIAKEAVEKSKREEDPVEEIFGYDPMILFLKNRIRQIGPSETSVMIIGEEGVGKKLVAKSLHFISQRRNFAFLTLDCSGLNPELLELELFGSSTGKAIQPGKLVQANNGSIYLSSIGDLSMPLQMRLLDCLKNRRVKYPNGEEESLNVRIFTGSKRDLLEEIQNQKFSMDLYYKLAEVPLRVPPLRDRRGDTPLLAHHFLNLFNRQYGKYKSFTPEALRTLSHFPWSGNVRELQNTIQYSVLVSPESEIRPESFSLQASETENVIPQATNFANNLSSDILSPSDDLSLKIATERLEAVWIKEAFQRVNTQEEAAKLLGISRGALQYKIKNNQFLTGYQG